QKNHGGNERILTYMLREYREPKDFASFVYLSQVQQAEVIKLGAEHLRRNRPRTMGSLYWQLNDCWPVASWASIDYFGRWKTQQFSRGSLRGGREKQVTQSGVLRCYSQPGITCDPKCGKQPG